MTRQLKDDAAIAAMGGLAGPLQTVHLVYKYIHGHIDHYYHFLVILRTLILRSSPSIDH
jgi:hypothetical protein